MRTTLLALFGLLPACWTFNPQTDFVQRTYFPSPPPPMTDVDLPTPAFAKERGFTKHAELMAFLDKYATAHPDRTTLTTIGESQKGRAIPMIRIAGAEPRIRIFLQGGLHGDEPGGTEGLLLLVHHLLEDPAYQSLADQVDVAIVPIANPDGFERQQRYAANGL
ncbi:MAG: M14 family zinc carboxypeptidase, partial [Myxococcota bacterium]